MADPLVELGHDVLAVDDSAEMLAHVMRARTHRARIEGLDLAERFDVVLLASHLVNTADDALRRALLDTARRHLVDAGRLLLQWHEPTWFDGLTAGTHPAGSVGGLTSALEVHDVRDGVLDATVSYTDGATTWRQHFTARRLEREELAAALHDAGLDLLPLAPAPSWLVAAPA